MVAPDEFRLAFVDSGLVGFDRSILEMVELQGPEAHWLVDVGLPRSAAPFLSFGGTNVNQLPTTTLLYGLRELKVPDRYRIIGSNGSGDPIAIDIGEQGRIVYLNHDDQFAAVFVNSSVRQLCDSLFAYKQLVDVTRKENGDRAYLEGNVPDRALKAFVIRLETVDPKSLLRGSMWRSEIDQLGWRPTAVDH